MDGFQLSKAAEPLQGGTLLFTTKLTSILIFPKKVAAKLLPTIFQFAHIDSKFWKKYALADCALSINDYSNMHPHKF